MPLVSLSRSISQNCLLNDDTVTAWLKHIIINTSRWKWNTSTFLRKHSLPRMKPKSIQIFVSFYLSWEVWHHAAETEIKKGVHVTSSKAIFLRKMRLDVEGQWRSIRTAFLRGVCMEGEGCDVQFHINTYMDNGFRSLLKAPRLSRAKKAFRCSLLYYKILMQ